MEWLEIEKSPHAPQRWLPLLLSPSHQCRLVIMQIRSNRLRLIWLIWPGIRTTPPDTDTFSPPQEAHLIVFQDKLQRKWAAVWNCKSLIWPVQSPQIHHHYSHIGSCCVTARLQTLTAFLRLFRSGPEKPGRPSD